MARTKRTSAVSEAAKLRLAGLQSIDPLLDLGGGLTVASFKADIEGLRRRYPEVRLRSLEQWLRDEGWHKRARHVTAPGA